MGAGHIGTHCLAHTKIPDSQKESRCSIKHVICTSISDTIYNAYSFGNGKNTLEIQVHRYQTRASFESRPSKDSSLGPAMLILFCTINFVSNSLVVKILHARNNNQVSNYLCTLIRITRLELLIRSY